MPADRDHYVSVDSVWEVDEARSRIRRVAGTPTDRTPTGVWETYHELRAADPDEAGVLADGPPRRGKDERHAALDELAAMTDDAGLYDDGIVAGRPLGRPGDDGPEAGGAGSV